MGKEIIINMQKFTLISGAVISFLGVAIGAFGAHGLRTLLETNGRIETFETAVKYQMYHGLALVLVGILYQFFPEKWLNLSSWGFLAGVIVFSGSLYLLCLTNVRWLGAITPLGGLGFLFGWAMLLMSFIKK